MKNAQLSELLYQALETELGGVEVYTTALRCARNQELTEEWEGWARELWIKSLGMGPYCRHQKK
jgi:hypothetical protein